jgi:threonine dehydratase
MINLEMIKRAHENISDHILRSPFTQSITLSRMHGCDILLKFENLQFTSSFKERGALNKILSLKEKNIDDLSVATASAGNHAQGVAYHAARLGIRADIFMPKWTPRVKVENTLKLGGNIILKGHDFDEAYQLSLSHCEEHNMEYVHPFNDIDVIAGQGTIGIEIYEDCPDIDIVIAPIGGGGLSSGVAVALKNLNPKIKIYGVQSAAFPGLYNQLHNKPAPKGAPTIAEGIAVKLPGEITQEIIEKYVDDVFVVDEWQIEDALNQLLMVEKTLVEGAGAAALALVQSKPGLFAGKKVGLILSGGNIDQRLLSSSLMRGLARSHQLVRVGIIIQDLPGILSRVTDIISSSDANIIDVSHQRHFINSSVREAEVVVTLETFGDEHNVRIIGLLESAGFRAAVLKPADWLPEDGV